MSEDKRRDVHVRLNDGEHKLIVSYVAPSPTWRVSYRVVAESDEGGAKGKALLQGWGLFDNRLEEDLDSIQVTLVAGQPISFIYDLYSSTIPHRETVKDEARTTGPIEFEAAQMDMMMAEPAPFMAEERSRGITMPLAEADGIMPYGSLPGYVNKKSAAQSTQSQAEGKATGETFQYKVNTPVSVKRGESALVPIVSAEVAYERELLFNAAKFANHPVAALRFTNDTGLTLERGPVTLVEDSDYKGDAILAFTTENNAVYLPYAIELGVRVKVEHSETRQHHMLNIQNGYLYEQAYIVSQVSYTIENTTDDAKTITIERAFTAEEDLFEMDQPDSETLNEKRWRVDVSAKSTDVFRINTRHLIGKNHILRNLKFEAVQRWADKRYLDQELFGELAELTKTLQFIKTKKDHSAKLLGERESIYQKQEQLRANLGALQSTGKEAILRDRVLAQLTSTQDRLEEIEKEMSLNERTITESEKRVDAIIKALVNVK
jgi:hypothetical protein